MFGKSDRINYLVHSRIDNDMNSLCLIQFSDLINHKVSKSRDSQDYDILGMGWNQNYLNIISNKFISIG